MIYDEQVDKIMQELHPCFAGYLHDGETTERDALAAIFQLFKNKNIKPIWEDDFFSGKIAGIKRAEKISKEIFEQEIIKVVFQDRLEVPIAQLVNLLKDGQIQEIINRTIEKQIQKTNNTLTLAVGSEKITNPAFLNINPFIPKITYLTNTVSNLRKSVNKNILEFVSLFAILVLIPALIFLFLRISKTGNFSIHDDGTAQYVSRIMVFLATSLMFIPALISKISVKFQLKGLKDPHIKEKMSYLFEFLSNHPMNNHNFNNEFLPYSIAFGIDNSWNDNFGLNREEQLEESALDIQ